MKRIVKKNYKIIIGIVVGLMISSIGVYALSSLSSSEVSYNNESSGLTSNTVQGAIDELYTKASTHCPDKYVCSTKTGIASSNSNIVHVYTYNQTAGASDYCVTGEEKTCKESECIKYSNKDSCKPGTIIDYQVNEQKQIRFHVVHDDGDTMTLQSQKNILQISWYVSRDNSQGPTTALDALEKETEDWVNVNKQSYTIGEKNDTLGYSGCDWPAMICSSTPYNLTRGPVRTRMITIQETLELGCGNPFQSCPIWMYNFLAGSTEHGGTSDGDSDLHLPYYWTMSASSTDSSGVWTVRYPGNIHSLDPSTYSHAIRAVVVITKD